MSLQNKKQVNRDEPWNLSVIIPELNDENSILNRLNIHTPKSDLESMISNDNNSNSLSNTPLSIDINNDINDEESNQINNNQRWSQSKHKKFTFNFN